MDVLGDYRKNLEQLKQTRQFLMDLNPTDFDLKSFVTSLESKITRTEHTLKSLQSKSEHRCGLCDHPYSEAEPKIVQNIKVCPTCRELGSKFKLGSDLEKEFGLPSGTIKRDCLPQGGNPPKLQPYIDCGLIFKSGVHNIVHEIVIKLYYEDENQYKRRRRSVSTSNA